MNRSLKWGLSLLLATSTVASALLGYQNPDSAEDIVRAGQTGVEPPTFTKRVQPAYPEAAMDRRIQGYVILEAVFRKDGTITNIEILRGLGKGKLGFEDASIAALRQWEFKPGRFNGLPADVRVTLKIDFLFSPESTPAKILSWDAPDLPESYNEDIYKPEAHFNETMKKDWDSSLSLTVDVEISGDGDLLRFVADPTAISQLAFPERVNANLERILENMVWKPAEYDGQGYRTLMRLELIVPLDAQPE